MKILIVATAAMVLVATICKAEAPLVVSGSSVVGDLVQAYANAFTKEKGQCNIIVNARNAGEGIKDLVEGKAQIAMTSRKMLDNERSKATNKGTELAEQYLGKISLAVIVNSGNPVKELSLEQLRKIFSGEYTNWDQVGGKREKIIVTATAVPETGAGVEFQRIVLKGTPYSAGHQVMPTYRDTVNTCSQSSAIGYLPVTSVYFHRMAERGVNVIPVKADDSPPLLYPTKELVSSTDYPITVPFYLYWNVKEESSCVRNFMAFCGQEAGKINRGVVH